MRKRCANKNDPNYKNYGGRGIKVCDRWNETCDKRAPNRDRVPTGFLNFVKDMGDKPDPTYTLERKNNDKNYCPENCKWADKKEQANNRRYVDLKGSKNPSAKLTDKDVKQIKNLLKKNDLTQKDIAKLFNVKISSISNIKLGVTWRHVTPE
jgi:predicted XRE-type DNA-binding protein